MKEELRIRMDKGLKTLIKTNAKASGMDMSVYARHVLKNAGIVEIKVNNPVNKGLSLKERQEIILQKAKKNESSR